MDSPTVSAAFSAPPSLAADPPSAPVATDNLIALRPLGATALTDVKCGFLSRLLVGWTCPRGNDVGQINRSLRAYGATALHDAPALWAEIPPSGPGFERALRPLGLRRADFGGRSWLDAQIERGPLASLDQAVLRAVWWASTWQALEQLIDDGPARAVQRWNLFLADLALRPSSDPRREEGEVSSPSLMQGTAQMIRRLHTLLADLAASDVHPELLARWRASAPALTVPRVPAAQIDLSAPERREVRMAREAIEDDLTGRLQLRPGETPREAVKRLSAESLRKRGAAWDLPRRLALFETLVSVGPRADAVTRLRRHDHVADYRGRGPALILRPEKTAPRGERHVKLIGRELDELLRMWEACAEKAIGACGNSWSPDGPLFPACRTAPNRPPSTSSIARAAAAAASDHARGVRGRPGVAPRADGRRHRGHSLRKASGQAVTAGRGDGRDPVTGAPVRALAEALADRDVSCDRLSYYGYSDHEGRERASARAIELARAMFVGPDGARKTRDVDAYRRALAHREALLHDRIQLLAGSGGPGTLQDQHRLQTIGRALDQAEERLRELREDEATLLPVRERVPDEELITDLTALEGALLSELRARPPAVRLWFTLPETSLLCAVDHSHFLRHVKAGRPIPTRDGLQPVPPGAAPIGDSQGQRRRRVPLALLDERFVDAPERRELAHRMLGAWPEGWLPRVCLAPIPSHLLGRRA